MKFLCLHGNWEYQKWINVYQQCWLMVANPFCWVSGNVLTLLSVCNSVCCMFLLISNYTECTSSSDCSAQASSTPWRSSRPYSGLMQQGLLFWEHSVGRYLLWHKSPGSSQCLKLIKLSLSQKEHMATNECQLSHKWAESTCKQRKPWTERDREE